MDDDLMSLRGGDSLSGGGSGGSLDDNPLGLDLDDFTPAAPPPAAAPMPMPEPEFDDPYSMATSAPIAPSAPIKTAAPTKAKPKAKAKPRAKTSTSSKGGFLGLTPQQGMVLSIFLFLDVAVMGCLILAVLNLLPI